MKLYEITNQYLELLNNISDKETGEIDENALVWLNDFKDDIKTKSISIASFIKNMEAERDAISDAVKAMEVREDRLRDKINYLGQYLKVNMERCEINEISCPYFAIKLKKCPVSVDIINEEFIPEEYIKRKEVISIDKIKLKNDLQSGLEITGASLKNNNRLEIK